MVGYAQTGYPHNAPLDHSARLDRLDRLARMLDTAFVIPGTGIRLGADAVVDLVPGIGNLVTTALSAWIVWEARGMGASTGVLARMVGNIALDAAISAVPVLGNVGDVFFRANIRNMALLRAHLGAR